MCHVVFRSKCVAEFVSKCRPQLVNIISPGIEDGKGKSAGVPECMRNSNIAVNTVAVAEAVLIGAAHSLLTACRIRELGARQ
eukprot:scaffold249321_cov71-Cyclotella_meneghiniana.AAC.3